MRLIIFSQDNTLLSPSRAPDSASCLRNYQTAPTYCEGTLFQWGVGNPRYVQTLAEPLEKYGYQYLLLIKLDITGDYVLDDVKVSSPSFSQVSWWTGLDGEKSSWQDYRHLDLLLPSQQLSPGP